MIELRKIPIYQALNRPNLLFGAERELVIIVGIIVFALVFLALSIPAFILGLCLWVVMVGFLRMMAKADPMMSKIYRRQLHFQSYYPARANPAARLPGKETIKKCWH